MRGRHRDLRPGEIGGQATRAARFWNFLYSPSPTLARDQLPGLPSVNSGDPLGAEYLDVRQADDTTTEWVADPAAMLPVLVQATDAQARSLRPPASVLEIGCGYSSLAARVYDALGGTVAVTATDISEVALERLERTFGGSRPGLRFLRADATNLGAFADGAVDLVVDKGMSDTLQFRARTKESRALRRALFAEVHRVLCPGGTYVLATPKQQPQYLHTVPWASVGRVQLSEPNGKLFDLGSRGDPTATVLARSAYVHVCRKPIEPPTCEGRDPSAHGHVVPGDARVR